MAFCSKKLPPGLRGAQQEALDFADLQKEGLFAILQAEPEETTQACLPDEDKSKSFDVKTSKRHADEAIKTSGHQNGKTFASSREDGEAELQVLEGYTHLSNPQQALEIDSINTETVPEEIQLETCFEGNTYQIAINQTRQVTVTPDTKTVTKKCSGHRFKNTYKNDRECKTASRLYDSQMRKNSDIATFFLSARHKKLKLEYKHKDNVSVCNHFTEDIKVIKEGTINDQWTTNQLADQTAVESNPQCRLLYSKILEGPGTKVINGKAITFDSWSRTLFFSCEGQNDAKCQRLRDQGGVLIGKKCAKDTEVGGCKIWQKTYDLGKKNSKDQATITFKEGQELYGFDLSGSTEDKNTELGEATAVLLAFSDLEQQLQESGESVDSKDARIFNGKSLKCKRSFLNNVLYDCCQKLDGLAIKSQLATCSEQEKCLSQDRSDGKCHYIGQRSKNLGTETEHIYCCFPTKLARVIHEQGRAQLGISWGDADKPKCRGFALDELQSIDFTKLDLSEVVEDLKVDVDLLTFKIKESATGLGNSCLEVNDPKNP